MKERLFTPLGLDRTPCTLPEEAMLFGAAVGHVEAGGDDPQVAPVWGLPRSLGPAGLITSTAARRARLRADAPDRRPGAGRHPRALGESPPTRWREYQADLPGQVHPRRLVGSRLDPLRLERPPRLIGHDGNTIGQAAFLRPAARGRHRRRAEHQRRRTPATCTRTSTRRSSPTLADVQLPEPFAPPAEPVDVDMHAVPRHLRPGVGAHGGLRRGRQARACGPRSPARSPRWCRTR